MKLRTRALASIGLVLVALALALGLVGDPLVRRTLDEHRQLVTRLSAIGGARLDTPERAPLARLWIAVALVGLVTPAICGVALRALLAPIDALRRACEKVPDWRAVRPLAELRNDELGHLCAAFDRMNANVEKSQRRLERYHGQLEESVVAKTRQLAATVERLRSLDQMKDAFVACASHELQDPVRTILAGCDELARPEAEQPRAELLRRVLFDCRHLDQMTQDLLDFVRTSADGFDYRFEATTSRAVVHGALALVLERMARSDVALELVHLDDTPVFWDAGWIARVLESILLHVLQRAPSGGAIAVDCRKTGPDVRIEMRFDRLPTWHTATGASERSRMGRAIWTPVLARHLGEWSEQESEDDASIVVALPASAEHIGWPDPAVRTSVEAKA
jgi:signal transduction histidine kinase